jgi:2-keto-4-pentenoate hydratase/2-oxohepta-3-ene-1,7-dioic acid hydratase in catechol pathway
MKLVNIDCGDGTGTPGLVLGQEVFDFAHAWGKLWVDEAIPGTIRGIISADTDTTAALLSIRDQVLNASPELHDRLHEDGAFKPLADTPLLAPIPDPGIIISAGQTYRGHVLEMAAKRGIENPELPKTPRGFLKNPNAVIGPEAPIRLPSAYPDHVDFEGEFAVVIGRDCHDVTPDEARTCIAGYTLVNDVSARDWASGKGTRDQTLLGKQFPTFCPLGPAVVTVDEIADPHALTLTTTLNGEVMQSEGNDDLIFSLWEIVAHYARFYLLRPGDIITSGTPRGTGHGHDPKVYLRDGDRVEITVDGIGTLGNPVAAFEGGHET